MNLVSHLEVPFGDSADGIAESHRQGFPAADLNIQTCRSSRWPFTRRRIVVVHWPDWWNHGFEPRPGKHVPRKTIDKLTLGQVQNLWSIEGHRKILTAEQAVLLCAVHGRLIPFFEMKPSIWNAQVLVNLRDFAAQRKQPIVLMTLQCYGKDAAAEDRWEAGAFHRMSLVKRVGMVGVLIFRREFDRAKWGPVLTGIKDHPGFGSVLATAPLIAKLQKEYQ